MREVLLPEFLVIQELQGKIGEQATISKLMSSQIDLPPTLLIMDVVLAPLFLPGEGEEGDGEGP